MLLYLVEILSMRVTPYTAGDYYSSHRQKIVKSKFKPNNTEYYVSQ